MDDKDFGMGLEEFKMKAKVKNIIAQAIILYVFIKIYELVEISFRRWRFVKEIDKIMENEES